MPLVILEEVCVIIDLSEMVEEAAHHATQEYHPLEQLAMSKAIDQQRK